MISAELGNQLEAFVASLVEKGRYNSKSEVLREGVRLIQERESWLATLDAALDLAREDEVAGRLVPAEEVFDRLKRKYRTMAEAKR